MGEILNSFKKSSLKLLEIDKNQANIINNLENSNITLQDIIKTLEPSKIRISGGMDAINDSILENVKKKLVATETKFQSLENGPKKLLSDLKAAILVLEGSKDPINLKIDRLEMDKKNLHEKLKELRTENAELSKKIKEIEKEGK
jgi:chromosome segregation ATPase